jgi:hypothetical protein
VTDAFLPLAEAEAASHGVQPHFVVVRHPVGGIGPEALAERVAEAVRQLGAAPASARPAPVRLALTTEEPPRWDVPEAVVRDPWTWYRWAEERGFGDGLPTLPPTAEAVERFLAQVGPVPADRLGPFPPLWRRPTAESLVANAILAGLEPGWFTLVWAALEAVQEEAFNLYGILATTHPCTPMVVVNGPARREAGVAVGSNCMGQGFRANAAIGRAVHLALVNLGGARPGVLDRATVGTPAKFTFCFGENEEASPWEPYHVRRGYAASVSTVTVAAAEAPHNINDHGSTTGEEILLTVAETMSTVGSNNLYLDGEHFVVFGPEHAATIAAQGWSVPAVQEMLYERSRVHVNRVSRGNRDRFERMGIEPRGDYYYLGAAPDRIQILVAGGEGKHSVWIPTFGQTRAVTRPVPAGWS